MDYDVVVARSARTRSLEESSPAGRNSAARIAKTAMCGVGDPRNGDMADRLSTESVFRST